MGYVPLFDNLTKGTLHGRWPDIGLWPVVLTLADRFGVVDVTPEYISSVTGLDLFDVVACMDRFCEPDPRSRTSSSEDQGRRLELVDPNRNWGWRVVNHAHYREKARLLSKNAAQTASGLDAERKRKAREAAARKDSRSPPESTAVSLSDEDGNEDKNTEKKARSRKAAPAPTLSVPGLNTEAWIRWTDYRRQIGRTLKPASLEAAAKRLAQHGEHQAAIVEQSIANGWQGLFELKAPINGKVVPSKYGRRKTADELEAEGR
jgi:hypothetical protein